MRHKTQPTNYFLKFTDLTTCLAITSIYYILTHAFMNMHIYTYTLRLHIYADMCTSK